MNHNRPISVNQWMGIFILLSIPFVNIILILVWAFSFNQTLKNFSRGWIKLTLICIGVFIAIIIGLGGKLPNPLTDSPFPAIPSSNELFNTNSTSIENEIHFNNLVYRNSYGMTTVSGEVTNSGTKSHEFTYIITFYDENKKMIGTATGVINNIEPNQTKTFESVTMDDVTGAKSYRANIDSNLK